MDQNPKQKSLVQFIKSQFLKRAFTKLIILSVSVFSLLFSHSTLLSFLNDFNFYYYSTLPFKLFSHTLDKNCTFLFCNGLLVFLANYSGLFSSSSSSSSSSNKYNLNDLKNYEDDSQPKVTIMETKHHHQLPIPLLEHEAEFENNQTQENKNAIQHEKGHEKSEAAKVEAEDSTEEILEEEEEEEEEEERAVLEGDKDKVEAEAETESNFFVEEEEEEGEGNGKLSDEELNKKFDDFIRKMKEDLRIEARQQLIMV